MSLIGCTVQYSLRPSVNRVGLILDKVAMRDKVDSEAIVTGYLIQEEERGEVRAVQCWRIEQVLQYPSSKDEDKDTTIHPDDKVPKRYVKGGYNPTMTNNLT